MHGVRPWSIGLVFLVLALVTPRHSQAQETGVVVGAVSDSVTGTALETPTVPSVDSASTIVATGASPSSRSSSSLPTERTWPTFSSVFRFGDSRRPSSRVPLRLVSRTKQRPSSSWLMTQCRVDTVGSRTKRRPGASRPRF